MYELNGYQAHSAERG